MCLPARPSPNPYAWTFSTLCVVESVTRSMTSVGLSLIRVSRDRWPEPKDLPTASWANRTPAGPNIRVVPCEAAQCQYVFSGAPTDGLAHHRASGAGNQVGHRASRACHQDGGGVLAPSRGPLGLSARPTRRCVST